MPRFPVCDDAPLSTADVDPGVDARVGSARPSSDGGPATRSPTWLASAAARRTRRAPSVAYARRAVCRSPSSVGRPARAEIASPTSTAVRRSRAGRGPAGARAGLRRHVRPQAQVLPVPDLLRRRRHPPPRHRTRDASSRPTARRGGSSTPHELPDFLPAVLEFSARAATPRSRAALLAAHREGVEVLRAALRAHRQPLGARSSRRCACRCPTIDARHARTLPRSSSRRVRRRRWSGLNVPGQPGALRRRRARRRGGAAHECDAIILLWVAVPYAAIAVFVVGHIWRYRYDKFGWTTRSSQLYENRLLRWGSPMFHLGHPVGDRRARRRACSSRGSGCTRSASPRRCYHFGATLLGTVAAVLTLAGPGASSSTAAAPIGAGVPGHDASWTRSCTSFLGADDRCSARAATVMYQVVRRRLRLPRDDLAVVPQPPRTSSRSRS